MDRKNSLTLHEGSGKKIGSARVISAQESLVTIEVTDGPIVMNEVGYICTGEDRLKAEVLRIRGRTADMQVFEDTEGIRFGDKVELTGNLLSVELGPGLLGQVFDGLQNPLSVLAEKYGFFLKRGTDLFPLDTEKKWDFEPMVPIGEKLKAGQTIGSVPEGKYLHKIMVPFGEHDEVEVIWLHQGMCTVKDPVAKIKLASGQERELTLVQKWPVRRPLPLNMLKQRLSERLYPSDPITTTQRIIDTFFPVALGGTACIPGPFGAGKTVLQNLISRFSTVDIVIIVACGERAGEVVETIKEFPTMVDPQTGDSLMNRTIIICNTSSMPVAARESSIYTGITLGEYYRQMGYNVLLIADSTSRWAQAMRETSGRLEEIPGEEAFPAYLESNIKSVYERAGVIRCPDGKIGSLTMIGTVSPAGGNFEEPVTQATLATVKTFLGLSYERAYRRCYPAIDPLISWSRYLDQLEKWFSKNISETWTKEVGYMRDLLVRGDSIYQMMQVTGEEGITLEDFITWQKSTFLDMVYLQQDAYDPVDASMKLERQVKSFSLVREIILQEYRFTDKDEVRDFFTRLTSLYRNYNYSNEGTPEYANYEQEIRKLFTEKGPSK